MKGKRILKWLIVCLVLSIVFIFVTSNYFMQLAGNHLVGWPVDPGLASKNFETAFQWDADLSGYQMQGGSFAQNSSPCKTAIYFLQNMRANARKETLIIARLVDLAFYNGETLDIQKNEIARHAINDEVIDIKSHTIWTSQFPNLIFNFRKLPKGERLRVYGIDTCHCRDTMLGHWSVKIIEGGFSEIGLEVIPNDGFVKNISRTIDFEGFNRYGALIFLKDKEGRTIMMIQFVESVKGEEYKPYLDSLLEKIPALSIKKL